MKNTKKFLSIILAVFMMAIIAPMAFAADDVIEVDGTGFSNFDEAITYVKGLSDPVEVKLLANINATNSIHLNSYREFFWPANAEKIDLNGYEMYFSYWLYFVDGTFTITDSSENGEGKITAFGMNIHVDEAEKSCLTLENGILEGRAYNYSTLQCYEDTVFTMTGGSVVDGIPTYCDTITDYDNSVINISGGTVRVEAYDGYNPYALNLYFSKEHNITGGTYIGGISCKKSYEDRKLKEFIPAGYVIKDENGNLIDKNLDTTGNITVTVEKHINHDYENGVCSACDYICEHTGGEATCVAKAVCEACGLEYGTIDADNHEIVNVEAKANTCTEIGWDAYEYCTECDYTTYDEKPILGHDIIIDAYVAPTCTETGLTEGQHCSRCDDMTVVQEVIPDLDGHINEDGNTTCDRCGETLLCEDCGRPVHEGFIQNVFCWFIMLFNLIKSIF